MPNSFESVLEEVQAQRKLRVWSLIMTFFGDAIVPRGGAVSAHTIQLVMERFHIAPGTVRTAFSRLTNDGWVIRERQGRNSIYRLSETGYQPFAAASERIYAAPSSSDKNKQFVLAIAPRLQLDGRETKTHLVSPRIQLFDSDDQNITKRESEGWFIVEATPHCIPNWVHEELLPQKLADGFEEMMQQFANVVAVSPIDSLALRTLLIHEWRRLLLRTPIIPSRILPDHSAIQRCQRQVMETYRNCLDLSEEWLNQHGQGEDGNLPPPSNLHLRFHHSDTLQDLQLFDNSVT